jgi:GDPmannose 4,6-dehydratase
MFIASAILFNHESPLRPDSFVTRKITKGAAAIAAGKQEQLTLGRLDVRRDWGAASDYVVALHLMLQHDEPVTFNVATGRSHSLDDFLRLAFEAAGVSDFRDRVVSDPGLLRPADVPETRGDPSKALRILDWHPTRSFEEIVKSMVDADAARLRTGSEQDESYL